jgi:hypothetical protein
MRGGREAVAVSATESGLRPVSSAGWPWTSSGPLKASLRVLGRIRDGSQSVQAHRGGGPDLEILGNLPPTAALLAPSHHLIAAHATLRAPACIGAIHVVRHEYVLNNVGQAGQAGQCVETDDIAGLDKSFICPASVRPPRCPFLAPRWCPAAAPLLSQRTLLISTELPRRPACPVQFSFCWFLLVFAAENIPADHVASHSAKFG